MARSLRERSMRSVPVGRVPKYDRRLIGTWRSDRRRTMRYFRPKPGCPPARVRAFAALFGKLVVRWGRGRYDTELDGYRYAGRYEIVARDQTSVVIRYFDPSCEEGTLRHIHFDGDYYCIVLGGGRMCEFFRRIPKQPSG